MIAEQYIEKAIEAVEADNKDNALNALQQAKLVVGWPENMSVKQAAEYLNCTQGYLGNMRAQGRGPTYSKHPESGRITYRRSDLDAWRNGGGK